MRGLQYVSTVGLARVVSKLEGWRRQFGFTVFEPCETLRQAAASAGKGKTRARL